MSVLYLLLGQELRMMYYHSYGEGPKMREHQAEHAGVEARIEMPDN